MSQSEFESIEEQRENVTLLTYLLVRGYEIETGEPFSVDNDIMQRLIETEIEAGNSVPEVTIDQSSDRTALRVVMTGGDRSE